MPVREIHTTLTKTGFICGEKCTCASIFFNTRRKDAAPIANQYILDIGTAVGEFARTKYPGAVLVKHTNMVRQSIETKELLASNTHFICEASFLQDGLFCAVDILEVTEPGHVKIIEVKSSTDVKDINYRDVAFQVYVLRKCGYVVDAAYLMYVNKEYVRDGELDPNEFFVVADVSEDVFNLQAEVEAEVKEIKEALLADNDPEPVIGEYCFSPYECPFWGTICKKTLPENSIFDIRGMQTRTKLDLYDDGICTMSDYLKTKKQNPKFRQQCLLTTTGDKGLKVDYVALKAFLKKIKFPIVSLDFETINEAIPPFNGLKPYTQIPFQFSMDVLRERGLNLEHFEYLANPKIDWRIEFAHKLVEFCPATGSVVVCSQAMERKRIEELAKLEGNEDIKDALLNIASRIVDVLIPLMNRVIYCEAMHGSYSVKHLLPALFPDDKRLSYQDLSINNGMLASSAFSKMLHGDVSTFEEATMRKALLIYCGLDTYGPLCILELMYKLINSDESELFKKNDMLDYTGRTIRVGDIVYTDKGLGKVVGKTNSFVKIELANGDIIRRRKYITVE